jgi:predicted  nucleic acid-binding Zn-ribbon protein
LQSFAAKERDYRNDIHRISVERNEMKACIQGHNTEMNAAKARYEETKREANELRSTLDAARKDKADVENKMSDLQQKAQSGLTGAADVADAKKRLSIQTEELQAKTKHLTDLERAYAELETRHENLKIQWEQQQTEISQHSAAIDSLRSEFDVQRREDQEKDRNTIDSAQNQIRIMKKEKVELQAKLEQIKIAESETSSKNAALVAERDSLSRCNTELRETNETNEHQILCVQKEKADAISKYQAELHTLRQRCEQYAQSLKNAEAKMQLQQTEHQKKLDFDRKEYGSLVKRLTEEIDRHKLDSTIKPATKSSHLVEPMQIMKPRKKVNRENQSVLNISGQSGTVVNHSVSHRTVDDSGPAGKQNRDLDHADKASDERLQGSFGSDLLFEDHGLLVVNPAAEQIEDPGEDTQQLESVGKVLGRMEIDSQKRTHRQSSTTSEQSQLSAPPGTDELTQLSEENRALRTPEVPKRSRMLLIQRSSQDRIIDSPLHSDNAFMSGLSSQDRPRSQANTGSRMRPPMGDISHHFGQDTLSPLTFGGDQAQARNSRKSSHISTLGNGNRSEFADHHSMGVEPNQGQRGTGSIDREYRHDYDSSPPVDDHLQKRKFPVGEELSSKRQRGSSQYHSTLPSSGPSSGASHHSSGQMHRSRLFSRSPSHQSSGSKSTGIARQPRVYGRHQTRSKSESASSIQQYEEC